MKVEERRIKVEKHYLPIGFELVVAMPNFVLDTEVGDEPEKELQQLFLLPFLFLH